MKHFLFIFIVFLLLPLITYADEQMNKTEDLKTKVLITVEEKQEIIPDLLTVPVEISALGAKESDVLNILGAVDRKVRNIGISYRGGNYNVYRNCWWEKDRQKCSGFKGEVRYIFELVSPEGQSKIFNALEPFKEKYGNEMRYSISNPSWIVSEKTLNQEENKLKITIIDRIKDFGKTLSSKLEKQCKVTLINYNVQRPTFPFPVYKAMAAESDRVIPPEPRREEKTIAVNTTVEYVCK
ncbi:hypothetical protein [Thermodesulfovibrio hydrogeniphilus]